MSYWHWSLDWLALACYLVAAAAHLAGLRGGDPAPRRQALAFQGGLLVALAALVSPVGYLAGIYLWLRMLQFLLLGLVAPGLIVLGAPWAALRAAGHRLGLAGPPGQPEERHFTGKNEIPGGLVITRGRSPGPPSTGCSAGPRSRSLS